MVPVSNKDYFAGLSRKLNKNYCPH